MELENEPTNIAPNQDSELDAALNKSFSKTHEVVENQVESQTDITPDPESSNKSEEVESKPEVKDEKPIVENKVLPDPDKIPDTVGKSSKSNEGWTTLKNNYKQAHRTIAERDGEITKLKTALAEKSTTTQKELEALKAEKADLEKYRAMVDIQADPEFISKYDEPIDKSVKYIKDTLIGLGVSQATIDAKDLKDPAVLQQIIDVVHDSKGSLIGSKLERKIREYSELLDQRDETLKTQREKYKETLESRKKESFVKQSENEGKVLRHFEAKLAMKDEKGNPKIPFLNKIEINENSTPQEKLNAQNHNALADRLSGMVKDMLNTKEPEHQAEIAIAAVTAHYYKTVIDTLTSQLNKEKEEKSKIAAINTDGPSRAPAVVSRKPNEYVEADEAVTNFFGKRR